MLNYSHNFDKHSILWPWGIWPSLIIGIVLIIFVQRSKRAYEVKAFWTVFVIGCLLAFLSPAMNGWDEWPHFFKVIAILDGKGLNAEDYNYQISESFYLLRDHRLDFLNCFSSVFRTKWSDVTVLSDRIVDVAAQVTYPSWGYLFCVIGVFLAKALNLSVGAIFFCGRIFNLLGFCVMGGLP